MSRYIDADALMKTLKISDDCKHCEQCEYDYFCSMSGDFVSACEAINEAPSIDIVFCKECIWRDKDNQGEVYCTYVKGLADINGDSFCSWGERSE